MTKFKVGDEVTPVEDCIYAKPGDLLIVEAVYSGDGYAVRNRAGITLYFLEACLEFFPSSDFTKLEQWALGEWEAESEPEKSKADLIWEALQGSAKK